MAQSTDWGPRTNCWKPVKPFGVMRHVFVDADLQSICLSSAREIAPDQVSQAESDNAKWSQDAEDRK